MAATIITAFTLASCGEEADVTPTPQPTPTVFSTGDDDDATRTSAKNNANFFWEKGDKIWVYDDTRAWKSSSQSNITGTQAKAKFILDGTFSAGPYNVMYTGYTGTSVADSANTSSTIVTIADQQTQSAWNNSAHIGTSGDCGTGYAHLQDNGSYTFTIDHKASYLIFYPYLHTALQNDTYTLQKIEIYSDLSSSNIAGTFNFDFNGLMESDLTTPKAPVAGTAKQEVTLTCGDAFTLSTDVPDLTTTLPTAPTYNHCFAVIAPGTHQLTLKYTLKNTSTNAEYAFYKDISLKQYAENSVYTFVHELRYPIIDFNLQFNEVNTFYRWGWPSEFYGTANTSYSSSTTRVSSTFWGTIPSVVGSTWYIDTQTFYDNSTVWKYNRRNGTQETMRGGWWLLKRSNISGYSETVSPTSFPGSFTTQGRPEAGVISNYFFMPAFGKANGEDMSYYWTASPDEATYARVMLFSPTRIYTTAHGRYHPYVAGYRPATGNVDGSNNTNWWQ